MTIKHLGGVFGRNPTFNDVTIEGQLTFDGDIDINSDLTIDGVLNVEGETNIKANSGSLSHKFSYNENGGEISLYDNASAQATLIDQANNTTRMLELVNGSNMEIGLGGGNTTGYVQFKSAGYVNAMRIDSGANVLLRTTSSPSGSNAGSGFMAESDGRSTLLQSSSTTSGTTLQAYFNPNGQVGAITTSGSATAYNTSSDYRLKEDVQPIAGATDRLKELKPVNFAWKVDGSRVDGFLAHEAQAIVPESVTGSKDAVDEDGNPVYQGIDQSKLVPLLVATIQELEARITALESN